jgi:uncharacterized protein with PIN domain
MKLRFLVDGMLGSLAVKLRIFGFDTEYNVNMEDKSILDTAKRKRRVIITSDRLLAENAIKQKMNCVLINEKNDEARLKTIFSRYKKEFGKINSMGSRCPKCNKLVSPVKKNEVINLVPKNVILNQEVFFKCKICGKIYWNGSHWLRLNELTKRLNTKLNITSS